MIIIMEKSMLEKLTAWYENCSQPYNGKKGLDNVGHCIGYYSDTKEEIEDSYDFPKGTFELISTNEDKTYYNWHYIPNDPSKPL